MPNEEGAGMQPDREPEMDAEEPTAPLGTGEQGCGGGGGGCLIATAAYGTEMAVQVQSLREARDAALLSTGQGGAALLSAFNTAYYAFSPHVSDLQREHPALRGAAAAALAPMLHALSVVHMAEPGSAHDTVAYGALATLLVAGMYVAAPVAGVWYAARHVCMRGRRGRASWA